MSSKDIESLKYRPVTDNKGSHRLIHLCHIHLVAGFELSALVDESVKFNKARLLKHAYCSITAFTLCLIITYEINIILSEGVNCLHFFLLTFFPYILTVHGNILLKVTV